MSSLDPDTGRNKIAAMYPVWISSVCPRPPYMLACKPRVKRTKWLASLCWKILHKIGGLTPFSETVQVLEYRPADKAKVRERVLDAIHGIIDFWNDDLEKFAIVMGAADFYELRQSTSVAGSTRFSVEAGPYRVITKDRNGDLYDEDQRFRYKAKTFDLPVHVVHTLSGVAVIPKVLIEVKEGSDASVIFRK